MQRRILGIAAALMLLFAGLSWWLQPAGDQARGFVSEGFLAFCWRMGAILAAAWRAYRDMQRVPTWLLILAPVALFILAKSPKTFLVVLPMLVLCLFLGRMLFSPGGWTRR